MDARLDVSRGFTNRRVVVRLLLTRRPTRPSTLPYSATDNSPVRPCGRFTRSCWLTDVVADSPVRTGIPRSSRFTRERLQLHLAIINFMADYFRPGTSGDIHLKYILLVHINFLSKSSLSLSWCAKLLMQDNCSLHQNDVANSPVHAGLQRRGRLMCLSRL